jgi:clan AA aspartic protease (TIGR02281 family)
MKKALLATAAIATLWSCAPAEAKMGGIPITCTITLNPPKNTYVVYRFNLNLGKMLLIETGYSKDGVEYPTHGAFWQKNVQSTGNMVFWVPEENPGYMLGYRIDGPSVPSPAMLFYNYTDSTGKQNSKVLGKGQCTAAYQPAPTTPAYNPPAPTYAGGGDSVPIQNDGSHATITVMIGSHPVQMLIDTGASAMVLNRSIADALVASGEARWSGRTEKFTIADGSTVDQPMIILNRVMIGSHGRRNVWASVTPTGISLLGFPVLNAIGPFTIDGNRLIFTNGTTAIDTAGQAE